MRAVQVTSLDGPGALRLAELPDPDEDDGKVAIEVHAAGVSFPDLLLSKGEYQLKPALPFVPGSEVAGVVLRAPSDAAVSAGERVVAFPGLGGFAETAVADGFAVFPLPDGVSFEVGAALPMNYLTVHFALVRRGRLEGGETILVHGAAGGVGTAAVQLGKALGARVIAVASSEEKCEVARRAGADEAIPLDGFKDRARELTDGRGVDMVVDPVGGDRFTDSLRSLAQEGRLLVLGFTGGEIPTVKVNRLLLNNIAVVGVGWGAFWTREPAFLRQQWDEILPLVVSGQLSPPIGARFGLESAASAVGLLERREALGKVLLLPRASDPQGSL